MNSDGLFLLATVNVVKPGPVVRTVRRAVVVCLLLAFAQGCGSGSLGSDVDNAENQAPVSKPFIQNGGTTAMFREGAEVILASKSEDPDGPILGWRWEQTSGPSLPGGLIERTEAIRSFTAPDVDNETTLTFDLSVRDDKGATDTESITVTVVPAEDPDEFLSFDFNEALDPFDSFVIAAVLEPGSATGAADAPFELIVRYALKYPDRNDTIIERALTSPDPVTGSWPANTDVPVLNETANASAPWNPRFAFKVPRLDLNDFNQQFIDGDRSQVLDPFKVDSADIRISVSLSSESLQGKAQLCLLADGVLVDLDDTQPALCESNEGVGMPTEFEVSLQEILNKMAGRESALTAQVYYNTVDPNDERLTLNQWLQRSGFAEQANGLLKAEAVAGEGEFAHAVYLNNYDLGFGRDMYMRVDEGNANVYSFVTNYASLEGAVLGIGEFVTVVMEYSPPDEDPTGEKFVKFFTYVPDGSGDSRRVLSMNFDGRGDRYTPGNCTVCHGHGTEVSEPAGFSDLEFIAGCVEDSTDPSSCYVYPNAGDLDSVFLPWDLESFLFTDTDPGIVDAPASLSGKSVLDETDPNRVYTREAQEAQLKKLNQGTLSTLGDDSRFDFLKEHLYGWYGGTPEDGTMPNDTFDETFVPGGWRNGAIITVGDQDVVNPDDADAIYLEVFAQHCRACHMQLEETLQLSSYQSFVDNPRLIDYLESGVMPLARLSMDRFWTSFEGGETGAQVLKAHLASLDAPSDLMTPGEARAAIAVLNAETRELQTPAPENGDQIKVERGVIIEVDGRGSKFADQYLWTLTHTAVDGLPQSSARLVDAESAITSFRADSPGTYMVRLAVNDAACNDGDGDRCSDAIVVVENRQPDAPDFVAAVVSESETTPQISLIERICPQGIEMCTAVLGDPESTVRINAASAVNGNVLVNVADPDLFRFESIAPASDGNGSFTYTIVDGDGDESTGVVTVTIAGISGPTASDDGSEDQPFTVGANTSVLADKSVEIQVLVNDGVSEGLTISLESVTDGSKGTVSITQNQRVVYTPNERAIGPDSFQYTIIDSNPVDPKIDTATVYVAIEPTVSFSSDAQNAFLTATVNCLNCHSTNGGTLPNLQKRSDTVGPSIYSAGRNVVNSPATAAESLLLTVPITGTVDASVGPNVAPNPHGGGDNGFDPDSTNNDVESPYSVILRWIEEGAPDN